MDGQKFCALPERLVLDAVVSRRKPHARWQVVSVPSTLKKDQIRGAVADAMAAWSKTSAVTAEEVSSGADLVIASAVLDGANGILAQCELPGPLVQHCTADSAERWVRHRGRQVPQGKIDIDRVMKHEIGHYWGIGHLRAGLMAPTYSLSIDDPMEEDIAEMVARYGTPQEQSPLPPVPGAGLPAELWVLDVNGIVTAKFKLTRLP